MKSRLFIVAAMLGLLATACNKDEVTPQDDMTTKTPITIKANYGNNGSKVSYTESGNTISATWQSGDKLLVIYNNNVNTLDLVDGAGENTATFSGDITGTPSEGAMLVCYVKDQNTPSGTITVNGDGSYIYTSDAFLGQDGTLAGASKLNLYCGWTRYSSSSDISCTFGVNTSMMKFKVYAPEGISEGTTGATLTYKSGSTELAKATFTVGTGGINTIYLTIPAGHYTGEQTLVYHSGDITETETLSSTQANFVAGQTYSKTLIFSNTPIVDPLEVPLTFEAISDEQVITFTPSEGMTLQLEYTIDGGLTWNTYTESITLNTGEKVSFRGDNESYSNGSRQPSSLGFHSIFTVGNCYIYGNIMSLINSTNYATTTIMTTANNYAFYGLFERRYGNNQLRNHPSKPLVLPATTLAKGCYGCMFSNCSNLTSPPNLPATILADSCYYNMFSGCSGITIVPELPATTLAKYCYSNMFENCSSIETAPNLPATILNQCCYADMFNGCTGLTTAPNLPATTLSSSCYSGMFSGCTSLHQAPSLPATTLADACYGRMFAGCHSLTQAPSLPATTLASSCYYSMFENCTGITTAPELPATTLFDGCYQSMFSYCTNLTTAPELPATTLTNSCYKDMFSYCRNLTTAPILPAESCQPTDCYQRMFRGCNNLNYIKCLAQNFGTYSTFQWVENVSASGTFVKAEGVNWSISIDGIPSGWTVQEE